MPGPKNESLAERLLAALASRPDLQHEVTFYASFAHKTFALMQREGPGKEGFAKLQQSFREAVEKVRDILKTASEAGFPSAEFLEISPNGLKKLMALIDELALVKQQDLEKKN